MAHMTVTVTDHLHERALQLDGLGTGAQKLIIQTGTLIINFAGSDQGGWIRDRLTYPVLSLPLGTGALGGVFGLRVQAIGTASPASINYLPQPSAITLLAEGDVDPTAADPLRVGSTNTGLIRGHIRLPVTAHPQGGAIPGAGWAVDKTEAVYSADGIRLVVDLAVAGPASVMRLAYSVFVAISTGFLANMDLEMHRPDEG
jgi:hypothetical protein